MKPRITLLTLGVADLERALTFYRDGMGLPTPGIVGQEHDHGAVVFIDMGENLKLALFPLESLSKDAGVALRKTGPATFSIAHNVNSQAEVDQVMEQARRAGATITNPAATRFWGGYSGYFQDPDGYFWEVAWNPQWPIRE